MGFSSASLLSIIFEDSSAILLFAIIGDNTKSSNTDTQANIITRGIKYSFIATYKPNKTNQIGERRFRFAKKLNTVRINAIITVPTTAIFLGAVIPPLPNAIIT